MAMQAKPHVVWICQWYPHEGDPYAGDFIQRHARAVAQFLPVTTFACFPNPVNKIETHTTGNLTENLVYFKTLKTGISVIDKAWRLYTWYQLLKKQVEDYISKNGKPDLLHCNIILNTGWLGLWAKKKYRIPYIASEHWSGYMPAAVKGFSAYNPWSKRKCKMILKHASAVTGVSEALIKNLQSIHLQANYHRIPNVVDEQIFNVSLNKKRDNIFRFIHISTFSGQKNLENMFAAFEALIVSHPNVQVHLVGPQEKLSAKWRSKKFHPGLVFHKEMPQQKLAVLMGECDVCVLYSHYETFGCVIIEANAIGLPVVVSDIPVLQEIVQPGINGILVAPSSPIALQNALQNIINNYHQFDAAKIANQALEKFAYQKIGKQFFYLYNRVISTEEHL